MKKKVALIFGITGQDGSYLAEILLKKKYIVHGVKRRSSSINTLRVDHIYQDPHDKNYRFRLHYGDVTDSLSVSNIIKKTRPHEIYNLAAQSHVRTSFEIPEFTANSDGLGTLRILEAIRILKLQKKTKFYQASTSEIFGNTDIPQNEKTPFRPRSPYAISKLYSYWTTINYREAYNIFAVNGILFNHEGPRRGETFITRKVTRYVAERSLGIINKPLQIGNVHAIRDWTDARDMVVGIYLIMQKKEPDDYVLGSGEGRTVLDLIKVAFSKIDIELDWDESQGIGKNAKTNEIIVEVNEKFKRPLEVNSLIADPTKANRELNWKPTINFDTMINEMIENDISSISNGK